MNDFSCSGSTDRGRTELGDYVSGWNLRQNSDKLVDVLRRDAVRQCVHQRVDLRLELERIVVRKPPVVRRWWRWRRPPVVAVVVVWWRSGLHNDIRSDNRRRSCSSVVAAGRRVLLCSAVHRDSRSHRSDNVIINITVRRSHPHVVIRALSSHCSHWSRGCSGSFAAVRRRVGAVVVVSRRSEVPQSLYEVRCRR